MLRKQFLRHSAVTARSPTSPLASQRSFLFPTLGKQIIGTSQMTRSQSTSTHFYLLWKPFNRIHRAINHWICFIPHFALLVIHITFKYFIKKYLVSKSSVFLFHLHSFQCCYFIQPMLISLIKSNAASLHHLYSTIFLIFMHQNRASRGRRWCCHCFTSGQHPFPLRRCKTNEPTLLQDSN